LNGPAIRYRDGGWTFAIHGLAHRSDGPADWDPTIGKYSYFIDGTPSVF